MKKILVTGGCGYIGSHTIVDLIANGYEVISIDNLSRGFQQTINGVAAIVGKPVKNYMVDLCHLEDVRAVFEENQDIAGIIHFAAYKSVPESVNKPLEYFRNNITSLLNILQCAREFDVDNFVFSSSCSVYGNADTLPVTEQEPMKAAQSPYARTKQMGEEICADFVKANPGFKAILLRYFNPVGAHTSSLIGELNETPENLVPVITQTAIGKRNSMTVFGSDYDTRDGSCIRDYIHVMDIAHAHTLAMSQSIADALGSDCEIFNLGTGEGVSVLELISAFEKVSGRKLNYKVGGRREGDVVAVYADNQKACKVLGWVPGYDMDAMMDTAWKWEQQLAKTAQKVMFN
ncbi:UDP-glucose 4-epimerase GalE [Taibaiella koreensis]|uniref:UDP-glucose 4-epimerase GalE n=1 Tax=Taibaiella koreensis TaxID=1268548 RepID=UPI000E5A0F0C|nr:UDP-glucose 4-epimerase GalE [Taibaiella koreensis]